MEIQNRTPDVSRIVQVESNTGQQAERKPICAL